MDVEGTHPETFPASVNAKRQAKAFILAPRSECSSKGWSQ